MQHVLKLVYFDIGNPELGCRHIDKSNSCNLLASFFQKTDRREIIIVPVVKNLVAVGNAGRNDIGNLPPHNAFGLGRIFDLIANGNLEPFPHQFGDVTLTGMMRKPGHGNIGSRAVRASGQNDIERFRHLPGVVVKRLVKITHTKQQKKIRIAFLDFQILTHHGSCFPRAFNAGFSAHILTILQGSEKRLE